MLPNIWIIWLSNLSILSVPDKGYSRNVSCTLNLTSTFLLIQIVAFQANFLKKNFGLCLVFFKENDLKLICSLSS
jgi:hypothetical protein